MQAALHDRFDFCALRAIHHRRIKHLAHFHAKLFQFLRSVFRFAGEEALLLHHGFEKGNRSFFVADFCLFLAVLHLLLDALFALLHLGFDQLLHLIDL